MRSEKKISVITAFRTVVCALQLTVTFVVLCCKKRSPWQAILLLVSSGLTATALLLPEECVEATFRKKVRKTEPDEEDEAFPEEMAEEEEEIFGEEESAEIEAQMHQALGKDREEETAVAPSARREILRDEEATEADFQ